MYKSHEVNAQYINFRIAGGTVNGKRVEATQQKV
jgi:hypothetical protein